MTGGGKPFFALIAARVRFDREVELETDPVMALVRTGSDRDRLFLDLGSPARWTCEMKTHDRPDRPVVRIRAEDVPANPSMVRIAGLDLDWAEQDLQYLVLWGASSNTALSGPPGGPDAARLFSFLAARYPLFRSIDVSGGCGTGGGSNMLWDALGVEPSSSRTDSRPQDVAS
jgi:hypothetical protein